VKNLRMRTKHSLLHGLNGINDYGLCVIIAGQHGRYLKILKLWLTEISLTQELTYQKKKKKS
jgi:hypothetical protein